MMKYLKTYEQTSQGVTFKDWLNKTKIKLNDPETTAIDCGNCNIIDLYGIEEFENLTYLDCSYNSIEDMSPLASLTKLRHLQCDANPFSELPDLNNVNELYCNHTKLKSLPILSDDLMCIWVYGCDLTTINNLPSDIQVLYCQNNQITSLDIDNLINLVRLDVSNNKLTSLPDLSNMTKLEGFVCDDNSLSSLPDLTNLSNLETLSCRDNLFRYTTLSEYKDFIKNPWKWAAKDYNI